MLLKLIDNDLIIGEGYIVEVISKSLHYIKVFQNRTAQALIPVKIRLTYADLPIKTKKKDSANK